MRVIIIRMRSCAAPVGNLQVQNLEGFRATLQVQNLGPESVLVKHCAGKKFLVFKTASIVQNFYKISSSFYNISRLGGLGSENTVLMLLRLCCIIDISTQQRVL
jgi:hypothetical protein